VGNFKVPELLYSSNEAARVNKGLRVGQEGRRAAGGGSGGFDYFSY
jgi:hypothetical protein